MINNLSQFSFPFQSWYLIHSLAEIWKQFNFDQKRLAMLASCCVILQPFADESGFNPPVVGDPYKWLSSHLLHHRQIQYGDGWMDEKRAELEPRTAWFQMGYTTHCAEKHYSSEIRWVITFQCWSTFRDFVGPSYDGWTKCLHFFMVRTNLDPKLPY